MIPLQLQSFKISYSRRASYVNRWEVVGNDKNQCVQMTRNDAEKKSNHLRGGRRETINSYLKLKTYLKYKYLLILKCDFR